MGSKSNITYLFFTIFLLSLIVIITILRTYILCNNKLIETFKENLENNDSEEMKLSDLNRDIMDAYLSVLSRTPTPKELLIISEKYHDDLTVTKSEIENFLMKKDEYNRYIKTQTNKLNNIEIDELDAEKTRYYYKTKVLRHYKILLPKFDVPDKYDVEFYIEKYKELNEDDDAFIEYMKKTTEYKTHTKKHGEHLYDKKKKKKQNTKSIASIMNSKENITETEYEYDEYELKRPEIGKSTFVKKSESNDDKKDKKDKKNKKDKKTNNSLEDGLISVIDKHEKKKKNNGIPANNSNKSCSMYKELMNKSDDLSELQNDRNFLELKYACERSKEIYANLDDDMVLLPDQKWNAQAQVAELIRLG